MLIILMISVSENFLVESEWFFLQNKICPFLRQGISIYNSFLWNAVGLIRHDNKTKMELEHIEKEWQHYKAGA
jgi:hypothetical protein